MLLKPDKDKEGGGVYPEKSYWASGPTRRSLQKFNSQTTPPPILKTKLITNKFVKSRLEIIDPKM
jgi:hypothetical protein